MDPCDCSVTVAGLFKILEARWRSYNKLALRPECDKGMSRRARSAAFVIELLAVELSEIAAENDLPVPLWVDLLECGAFNEEGQ